MADIAKRITDMFDEEEIVVLLEQHGRYRVKDNVEVVASRHGSGWYISAPTSKRGVFVRVGRTGVGSRAQLRPFRCLQDAFQSALSRENREKWRTI
jgi:hypothetical protein